MDQANQGPCSYQPSDYYEVKVMQTTFQVPSRYSKISYHGSGAFSSVAKAYDIVLQRNVAIKKLSKPFYDPEYAKRTYREMYLLSYMNHHNIICLIDVFSPQFGEGELNDVYLVTPWMEADLKSVLKQHKKLPEEHVRFFAYQLILAVRYLHSMNIMHRDIKPANLAINEDNDLKILDFGLSRKLVEHVTGYVVTRWYRSPEVLVNWEHYSLPVDVWAAGCVIAEMITGKPLFPGDDAPTLILMMCSKLGKPDEQMMSKIKSQSAAQFIRDLVLEPTPPFESIVPEASPQLLDLIKQMLTFDPDLRITADQAVRHPLFDEFTSETDKAYNLASEQIDCTFEEKQRTVPEWKEMVQSFMKNFTPKLDSLNSEIDEGDSC